MGDERQRELPKAQGGKGEAAHPAEAPAETQGSGMKPHGESFSEEALNLLKEATDHTKTTWSHVMAGKATTAEYEEAGIEAAVVGVAAMAGGIGLIAATDGVAALAAEETTAQILTAAAGKIIAVAGLASTEAGIASISKGILKDTKEDTATTQHPEYEK